MNALYLQYPTPNHFPTLSKSFISSVLTPSGNLQNFQCFLLSESIWRALSLLVLVLDTARTMHGPAEHFIRQKHCGD